MTVSAFLQWSAEQPGRHELVAGVPVAMAPERADHARTKAQVWLALRDAIRSAGLDCEAFTDGMTVPIDEETAYEPDALVRCGERLEGDEQLVPDPVVVVEVVSPTTAGRDAGAKLDDYFRLDSVTHYLLVKTDRRVVIHHAREADGDIRTTILSQGDVDLTPPGLRLPLSAIFMG